MPEPHAAERTGRVADLRQAGPVRAGALELDRLGLEPHQRREWRADDGGEHLLYVIRGSGSARVKAESLELARESVLWLDPGEQANLIAGADGLEVLTARAPA
jgi:quercetin dioxygenase-like cupin family protein